MLIAARECLVHLLLSSLSSRVDRDSDFSCALIVYRLRVSECQDLQLSDY